jgi:hypothetical protein
MTGLCCGTMAVGPSEGRPSELAGGKTISLAAIFLYTIVIIDRDNEKYFGLGVGFPIIVLSTLLSLNAHARLPHAPDSAPDSARCCRRRFSKRSLCRSDMTPPGAAAMGWRTFHLLTLLPTGKFDVL